MYKKGAGNDKQRKDAGNRTLCPYRNFSQAIILINPSISGMGGVCQVGTVYKCNFCFRLHPRTGP